MAVKVALFGQSLFDLVILCSNYLIPGSRIEISIGLWIDPTFEKFRAKIFVLGRKSEKDHEIFEQISAAVDNKNHNAFKNECVQLNTTQNFNEIDFNKLDCDLLAVEDFSENERLHTDFCFKKKFIDFTNVERTFKIEFLSEYKIVIYNKWIERKNKRGK